MHSIRIRLVVAWTISLLLFFQFITSGLAKLVPAAELIERFAAWGYGPAFARVVGVVETAGAVLVLSPGYAFWGAALLLVVMFGALWTHWSTGIGDPGLALTLAFFCAALLALRYADARGLRRRER